MNITNADILNMALDTLMIAAIVGLWLMWTRAARRQRQIEALLSATTEQLDTALSHMEQVMTHIRRLEAAQSDTSSNHDAKTGATTSRHAFRHAPPSRDTAEAPASSLAHTAPITRVLRLHREGCKAEEIARREEIPLAKVRLMLKLHAHQAAA